MTQEAERPERRVITKVEWEGLVRDVGRLSGDVRLMRTSLETLTKAIEGRPEEDIVGIRTRLRIVEQDMTTNVRKIDDLLRTIEYIRDNQRVQDEIKKDVTACRTDVVDLAHKVDNYRSWVKGLGIGLTATGIIGAANLVLEFLGSTAKTVP